MHCRPFVLATYWTVTPHCASRCCVKAVGGIHAACAAWFHFLRRYLNIADPSAPVVAIAVTERLDAFIATVERYINRHNGDR